MGDEKKPEMGVTQERPTLQQLRAERDQKFSEELNALCATYGVVLDTRVQIYIKDK